MLRSVLVRQPASKPCCIGSGACTERDSKAGTGCCGGLAPQVYSCPGAWACGGGPCSRQSHPFVAAVAAMGDCFCVTHAWQPATPLMLSPAVQGHSQQHFGRVVRSLVTYVVVTWCRVWCARRCHLLWPTHVCSLHPADTWQPPWHAKDMVFGGGFCHCNRKGRQHPPAHASTGTSRHSVSVATSRVSQGQPGACERRQRHMPCPCWVTRVSVWVTRGLRLTGVLVGGCGGKGISA